MTPPRRALTPEVWLAMSLAAIVALAAPLNHDVAWFLVMTRRMLDGARLYVDVIDMNPPMYLWLLALPASLGRALGLSDQIAGNSLPAIAGVLATWVSAHVLSLAPASPRIVSSGIICLALLLAIPVSLFDFGQRDSLAALLFLPYALLAARAAEGRISPFGLTLSSGVMGAIGVALKPYFVLPWLAVESVVFLRTRSWRSLLRSEAIIVAVGQVVFAALVLLVTPEYLTRTIPLAQLTYNVHNQTWLALLSYWTVISLELALVASALALVLLRGRIARALVESLLAAGIGFLACFVLQGKGYGYHLVPALVFAPLALGVASYYALQAARSGAESPPTRRMAQSLSIACLCVATMVGLFVAREVTTIQRVLRAGFYEGVVSELTERVRAAGSGVPVYFLSISVAPAFPVVNFSDASYPYHFNSLWPLPAFYLDPAQTSYRSPESQGPEERAEFEIVVNDLLANPPRFLVVDRTGGLRLGDQPFDYLSYYGGSEKFAALFSRYHSTAKVGDFEVFEPLP